MHNIKSSPAWKLRCDFADQTLELKEVSSWPETQQDS